VEKLLAFAPLVFENNRRICVKLMKNLEYLLSNLP